MKIVASSAFACNAPVNARARKADTQRILLESGGPELRARLFWQTWQYPHQESPLGVSGDLLGTTARSQGQNTIWLRTTWGHPIRYHLSYHVISSMYVDCSPELANYLPVQVISVS